MIRLITCDGKEILVEKDIMRGSKLIEQMLNDVGDLDEAIPLLNISSDVLDKVVTYLSHHSSETSSTDDTDSEEESDVSSDSVSIRIDEWDKKYISVDFEQLFKIILAANYLDIKPLLDLACRGVANVIKGKSPEEIRTLFNIENDFTPEEEEQIKRENAWANIPENHEYC